MLTQILNVHSYRFMPLCVPYFLTAVLVFFLGWLVLLLERRSKTSLGFFILTNAMVLWLAAIGFTIASSQDAVALWWIKYVEHLGVAFIPAASFFYTVSIVGRYREFKRLVIAAFGFSTVSYFIFSHTGWFLADLPNVYTWGRYPRNLWPSLIFVSVFAVLATYSLILCFKAYRTASKNIARARFRLLSVAFAFGYAASIDFLPNFGLNIYPVGFFGTAVFIALSAYTFRAYRFMDITPAAAADQILDTMKDMLLVTDIDFNVRFINQAVTGTLGFFLKDIAGRPAASLCGGTPKEIESFSKLLLSGKADIHEVTLRSKDGAEIFASVSVSPWINGYGDTEGYILIFRDISERKRALENLRASEERFQKAFHAAPFLMSLSELDTGRFIEVNKKFCEVIGLTRAELIGKTSLEVGWIAKETRQRLLDESDRISARVPEIEFHDKTGKSVICSYAFERLRLGGRPIMLAIGEDITGLKKAEAAMQSAAKLESLGTLAGGIAHDFNNLLMGILGNLSLIKAEGGTGGEIAELVQEAETACFSAKSLARQLLTFASGGEPIKKTVDIAALVKESVTFSLRGSGIGAAVHADGGPCFVNADKDQFFQVMHNLVINAMQAMPDGGAITVNVTPVSLKSGELPELGEGRYARIVVRDTGTGIPPEVMPRLFEPYFSTKAKGRGLGLAVSRSIIVRHGGQIDVLTERSKGSAFTIHLPIAETPPDAEKRLDEGMPAKGSGRILIMDDEEVVYKALRRMLTALGYEAEVATNGEQALEMWKQAALSDRRFAAVIMDLTITGGMGGAEAIKRLLELDPGVKAVVSSGYSEDPIMSEYAEHGFSGVLSKPYNIDSLAAVMKRVLRS